MKTTETTDKSFARVVTSLFAGMIFTVGAILYLQSKPRDSASPITSNAQQEQSQNTYSRQ